VRTHPTEVLAYANDDHILLLKELIDTDRMRLCGKKERLPKADGMGGVEERQAA